MRASSLLDLLSREFTPEVIQKATFLASENGIGGGWEGWLQAETALCFFSEGVGTSCQREQPYPPPNSNYRCDLCLNRADKDLTYVELKCMNPYKVSAQKALDNSWASFTQDIRKIIQIGIPTSIALLAVYGYFTKEGVGNIQEQIRTAVGKTMMDIDTFAWDTMCKMPQKLISVDTTSTTNRLILVATSPVD